MSPADDAAARANDLAQHVRDFFTTVDEILRDVGGNPVGADVVGGIREGMRSLNAEWDELWAKIQDFLAHRGDSAELRRVAQEWSAAANDVGAISSRVAPDQMTATIEWEGSAAEAYRLAVPPQHDALGQVKTSGVAMSTSLHALADAIDNFWIAVGVALAACIVGAVGAVATAIEVVTVPAAIAILVGAIGIALGALGVGFAQGVVVTRRVQTDMRSIDQNMTDLGPSWPRPNPAAASALSDASVTDGDPSDWRPRR